MNEVELIKTLKTAKKILLVEPPYKRKYPPLGLMKISSFAKDNNIDTEFVRQPKVTNADIICVTSLFTYDSKITIETIKTLKQVNPNARILIGGVAPSVNRSLFNKYGDVFRGYSRVLDSFKPDYLMPCGIEERWVSWSYVFTTRGCPNSCGYCFVPKIERGMMVCNNWESHVDLQKPFAMIMDNNMTAFGSEHTNSVASYFSKHEIKCCLDNALDCKFIDTDMATAIARIPIVKRGLRTAFDRIDEDGVFQLSIEKLLSAGISKYNIMAYILYNYNDTPKEANYRAKECVKLGIAPYPARYKPIKSMDRKNRHVSARWTDKLAIAFNHFWLMAGLYRKYDFEDYAKNRGKERYNLNDKDWAYWNEEKNLADSNSKGLEGRSLPYGEGFRQLSFGEGCEAIKKSWGSNTDVLRVANGVSNRVDRIKGLGNAIVPQVVVPIMQAIKEIENG